MLVLSRRKNESIVIPIVLPARDDHPAQEIMIRIVVLEIRGDKVRLGFEAPTDVPVHRLEVYEAIQRKELIADDPQAA